MVLFYLVAVWFQDRARPKILILLSFLVAQRVLFNMRSELRLIGVDFSNYSQKEAPQPWLNLSRTFPFRLPRSRSSPFSSYSRNRRPGTTSGAAPGVMPLFNRLRIQPTALNVSGKYFGCSESRGRSLHLSFEENITL